MKTATFTILALMLAAIPASADSWSAPGPRVFAPEDGGWALKAVPVPGKWADCVLERVDIAKDGSLGAGWKTEPRVCPVAVRVAPRGHGFVTFDAWARVGYAHALVVYGPDGKQRADYALEDLLTAEEIRKNVQQSVSSRWWRRNARLDFEPDGKTLRVQLGWGKTLFVDMETGKLKPAVKKLQLAPKRSKLEPLEKKTR